MQILILIFAEVLGLYGLIVALIMNSRAGDATGVVCSLSSASLGGCPHGSNSALHERHDGFRPLEDVAMEGGTMGAHQYTDNYHRCHTLAPQCRMLSQFYVHVLYGTYNTTFRSGRLA